MKPRILLALPLVAAACVQYQKIETQPVTVTFTDQSVQDAAFDYEKSPVRSVTSTKDGQSDNVEVTGLPCTVTGTGFEAEVISPAYVMMPKFRGGADVVTVTCTAGTRTESAVISATNFTLQSLQSTGSQTSLLGALVEATIMATWTAKRDPLQDVFVYYLTPVVFEGTTPESLGTQATSAVSAEGAAQ